MVLAVAKSNRPNSDDHIHAKGVGQNLAMKNFKRRAKKECNSSFLQGVDEPESTTTLRNAPEAKVVIRQSPSVSEDL